MPEATPGQRIKALRQRFHLSQVDLAALLGVSNVTVNRWEHDRATPQPAAIDRLAQIEREGPGFLRASTPPRRGNLPAVQGTLLGRDTDLENLGQLLRDRRFVTITGPAGVGKTQLAIRTAIHNSPRFPDGIWFADLAAVTDAASVPNVVARVLGLRESGRRPLIDRIAEDLRTKHLLLILDNCEHILPAAVELATSCLANTSVTRLLATSRIPLAIPEESVYPLSPLPLAAAELLFRQRAQERRPDLTLTDEQTSAISQLVRRLDGLPLAIELAAARAHILSIDQISARLDRRFDLLRTAGRAAPRQLALDTAIAWSYDLLDPAEAALFRRLGVFSGWFDLPAVEAVCGTAGALDILDRLARQSMIVVKHDGAARSARYHLLESLAAYARELLDTHGETVDTEHRHATYYATLARSAAEGLRGRNQIDWLTTLDREFDNLLAALTWAIDADQADLAVLIAGSLAPFWLRRSRFVEGSTLLARALALPAPVATSDRIAALNGLSLLRAPVGQFAEADNELAEAIALSRSSGDRPGEAQAHDNRGLVERARGDLDAAGSAHCTALAIWEELGNRRGQATSRLNLGLLENIRGDHVAAEHAYHEAWALADGAGDLVAEAAILANLGEVASRLGQHNKAIGYFDRTLNLLRAIGDPDRVAIIATNTAELRATLGEFTAAAPIATEAVATFRAIANTPQLAGALYVEAVVLAGLGRRKEALALLRESLTLYHRLGDWVDSAFALEAIAPLLAAGGDAALAARLLGGAEAIREADDVTPYAPFDYEGVVAAVRRDLGPDRFATHWAKGRAQNRASLIAEAIHVGDVADGDPVTLLRLMTSPPPKTVSAETLTDRQIEVLRLVAAGRSNREIALDLGISPRTVERHLSTIFVLLDADRRSAAVATALARGLLPAPAPD